MLCWRLKQQSLLRLKSNSISVLPIEVNIQNQIQMWTDDLLSTEVISLTFEIQIEEFDVSVLRSLRDAWSKVGTWWSRRPRYSLHRHKEFQANQDRQLKLPSCCLVSCMAAETHFWVLRMWIAVPGSLLVMRLVAEYDNECQQWTKMITFAHAMGVARTLVGLFLTSKCQEWAKRWNLVMY